MLGWVAVKGVHPVDRDPAADEVEVRGRLAQCGGAVGGVGHQLLAPDLAARTPRTRELLGEQRVVAIVGRGEVGHQTHGVGTAREPKRPIAVLGAEAPHPGVELHVHARRRLGDLVRPGHHVRARVDRDAQVVARERAHDEHRHAHVAQLARLGGGGDRQPARAPGERSLRHPSVPVAVRLDYCAQRLGEPGAVALDRAEVDACERALGRAHAARAPSTSTRVTIPTSRPSSTTGRRL